VSSIAEYFQRVKASNAQKITEIVANEFGEPSFSLMNLGNQVFPSLHLTDIFGH
jgi:hypothetical protein